MALSGVATRFNVTLLERLGGMIQEPSFQETITRALQQQMEMSALERLVASIPGLVIFGIVLLSFTVLGGILGVALFEKRKAEPPPLPPQYPPQYPPQHPPQYPPPDPPPVG
jgi:hypothetical protein